MARDKHTIDVRVRAFDEEMVERAARALYEHDEKAWRGDVSGAWDAATDAEKRDTRDAIRVALRAALIRSEVRDG